MVEIIVFLCGLPASLLAVEWSEDQRVSDDPFLSRFPAITCDTEGRVHVAWESDSDIYYRRYENGAWTEAEWISVGPYSAALPAIQADLSGGVHVVWETEIGDSSAIAYRYWNGSIWSPVQQLSRASRYAGYPSIAVDAMNRVHVVWNAGDGAHWFLYHKIEDGGTWTPDAPIVSVSDPYSQADLSGDPLGNVHLVWSDNPGGNYDVYYKRWNGSTWGVSERLTTNPAVSATPTVAGDRNGLVHVAWEDTRNATSNWEIYYRRWNGVAWTPEERLTDAPRYSEEPAAAVDPTGVLHLIWYDDRDSPDESEIYYKSWDGVSWSPDTRLTFAPGMSRDPAIAIASDGTIHIAWADFRNSYQNPEIYAKHGRGISGLEDGARAEGSMRLMSAPNPFRSGVSIRFLGAHGGLIVLELFDSAGRRVRKLDALIGSDELRWDGRDDKGRELPAGVYLTRITTVEGTTTGRVVLAR